MAEAVRRRQVLSLCSTSETTQKAHSILRVVTAKTRPGSGFVVKAPTALAAICAYLASEQLNNGEVSLEAARNSACISQPDFSDALKTVRAALRDEYGGGTTEVTYGSLVDSYRIHPREQAVACMEDTEGALSQINMLKERHGANVILCAIFYWVCHLMEEPTVQERSLCQTYRLPPKAFKAMVTTLNKHCELIARQIKSCLLQKQDSAGPSTTPRPKRQLATSSTQHSPVKSAMKPRSAKKVSSTPATTPSTKRVVVLSHPPSGSDNEDQDDIFPETPTKKRKLYHASPTKPRVSTSPTKSSAEAVAAFHAALTGSHTKRSAGHDRTETQPPEASPSTPRRPRFSQPIDLTHTPTQPGPQSSPSRSRVQSFQPSVGRRFRPVFLEQQQWCDRDPKVEQIWADAGLYGDKLAWTFVSTASAS